VGVPLPTGGEVWGGLCHLPINFLNFYIKIVSFRASWVEISYRLGVADCFTRIGNTLKLKFTGDGSSILGTRPIILPPEKCAPKMTKMHEKLLKEIARRLGPTLFLFSYISVFILLKFLRVVD